MTPHVLLVTAAPDPSDELLELLQQEGGTDVEVAVVAPVVDESLLEWFADDDRRAREEARRRAIESAEAEALGARVVGVDVGDPDPIVAIKVERLGLPVTYLVDDDVPSEAAREVDVAPTLRFGVRSVLAAVMLLSAALIVVALWLYFSLR
ncbi:MAG: hypothetical protein ACXVRS_14805 [Gaiellaceae bacterium]